MTNFGGDTSEEWAVSGVLSLLSSQDACGKPHTIFSLVRVFKLWIESVVYNTDPT